MKNIETKIKTGNDSEISLQLEAALNSYELRLSITTNDGEENTFLTQEEVFQLMNLLEEYREWIIENTK
jgi:hypothetical protein